MWRPLCCLQATLAPGCPPTLLSHLSFGRELTVTSLYETIFSLSAFLTAQTRFPFTGEETVFRRDKRWRGQDFLWIAQHAQRAYAGHWSAGEEPGGLVLEGVKDLFEENEVGCSWNADLLSQCQLTSWTGVLPPGLGVGGV